MIMRHTFLKGNSEFYAEFVDKAGVKQLGRIESFKSNVVRLLFIDGECRNITTMTEKGTVKKSSSGSYRILLGRGVDFVEPNQLQFDATYLVDG